MTPIPVPRFRDGLLPALILSLLLLQYAATGHLLAHFGVGGQGIWAGAAPFGDDDPAEDSGGCEAPQLHAVIDGTPLVNPPSVPGPAAAEVMQHAFLRQVADRWAPEPLGQGPPTRSL